MMFGAQANVFFSNIVIFKKNKTGEVSLHNPIRNYPFCNKSDSDVS